MRLFILFTLCFILFANLSNAQEICNNNLDDDGDGLVDCLDGECGSKVCEICDNGRDDDGDGFVDCYDKECNLNGASRCDGFFLGKFSECNIRPDSSQPFQMQLKFTSLPNQVNHVSRLLAGDINGDGRTELVSTYTQDTGTKGGKINVFKSIDSYELSLTQSFDVNTVWPEAVTYEDIAMADINGDGCAEIFAITKNFTTSSSFKVVAYDCNGTPVWASPINFVFDPGLIGLADFDGDGLVELYSRTQIFDAHTGKLLGNHNIDNVNTGIHNGINKGWGMNSNGSIAVDIISESLGLELVAGCRIYGVFIDRGAMTATLTLLKEYDQYATRTSRGQSNPTSVADFNQDGYLDVLAVGSEGKYDDNTTIFFWDVQNNVVKKYIDNSLGPLPDYIKGWKSGAGRINIADIDGDTLMDAVYVSGGYLYALKESATALDLLWRVRVADETSGYTGCTTFDFNGDNMPEIVYRDENYLYIFSTDSNGVVVNTTFRCASRTYNESPIVVDINGDGSAEICVTCSTSNATAGKDLTLLDQAELRVYGSANVPWIPARKVWNQNGYFVVNVNDDLTIPRVQQLHHLVYAKNKEGGTVKPFNSFLNQTTYLNSNGLPSYPAVNLALVPASATKSIDYLPFTCLDDSIQVTFKYTNRGDISAYGELPISFYSGDPKLLSPLATRLDTKSVLLSGLNPGDTITSTVYVKNQGSAFDLYIVVNDNGTTIPLDIPMQPDRIIECDYDNIINAHITPNPVSLVPELIRDNLKCLTAPGVPVTPNNGAVNAYALIGGVNDSTNFNFYWSIGTTAKPLASADYIGHSYAELGSGAYTVYAVHKTINCSSDTVTIVVNEVISGIDARIILEKEFDNLENPNGELSVVVNDSDNDGVGDPKDNFKYTWYEGLEILIGDTISTSYIMTGLGAGTYSVLVSNIETSCYDSAYATIYFKENVLSSEEDDFNTGISLYPNPGTDGFTILIDNVYIGEVQFQLQSVLGNEVDKTFYFHKSNRLLSMPVATHEVKSGVYLIKISLGKKMVRKKWIKL